MTLLYDRAWKVRATQPGLIAETREWSELDIDFDIEKTNDRGINEADLTIINLSEDSRRFISAKGTVIEVYAGYQNDPKQIFKGEVELCSPERSGNDWLTKLELRDGASICRTVKADKSFKKATPHTDVFNYLIDLLLTAPNANITPLAKGVIELGTVTGTLTKGESMRDLAFEHLYEKCKSFGLILRVTDFRIHITKPETNLLQETPVIDKASGLIGSPEITEDGITVVSLMREDLEPGAYFRIESEAVKGQFQVANCRYKGQSDGGSWEVEIDGIRY